MFGDSYEKIIKDESQGQGGFGCLCTNAQYGL